MSDLPNWPQGQITSLQHTPMPKKFGDFLEITHNKRKAPRILQVTFDHNCFD